MTYSEAACLVLLKVKKKLFSTEISKNSKQESPQLELHTLVFNLQNNEKVISPLTSPPQSLFIFTL